jgi:hypothetical protein
MDLFVSVVVILQGIDLQLSLGPETFMVALHPAQFLPRGSSVCSEFWASSR